jgi:ribose transport system permease protein
MIGAVLIAVVSNGMNVLNVQSYWQSLVIGLIILAGVSFDTYRRSRARKPSPLPQGKDTPTPGGSRTSAGPSGPPAFPASNAPLSKS